MLLITEILKEDWQRQLRCALRRPSELAPYLDLPPAFFAASERAQRKFPFVVTHSFVNRMERANPNDPLLLQILPSKHEMVDDDRALLDPVGERDALVQPGLLHKYASRVLAVTTSACAIHCRYCFRRNFAYEDIPKNNLAWRDSLNFVAGNSAINEVILSGGDPLSLIDDRLFFILDEISKFDHVKTIRLHTRIPVVLPARITDALCAKFKSLRQTLVLVIHANHGNELRGDCIDALLRLRQANTLLLNQSVLLRGINDSVEALKNLSQELFAVGVLPYYLHRFDKVQGAMHFEVKEDEGINLIKALQKELPGYLVPKFVREDAGEGAKTLLA